MTHRNPPRRRAGLTACLLTLLLAPLCTSHAQDGDKTVDQKIHAALRTVINHGADLYNKNRDHDGCFRVYHGALLAVRPLLAHHPDLQKAIDAGVARADTIPVTWQKAFALREVLDQIRGQLGGPGASVGTDKGLHDHKASGKGEKKPAVERPITGAARCESALGVLLRRDQHGGEWHPHKANEDVPPESLLVALPDAEFRSANGAVGVKMTADLGQRGPYPVLESAVKYHEAKGVDLDLTLDRGIVGFANLQEKGPARIRLRFQGKTWVLTLANKDTRVGVEVYGRHPPGAPTFTQKPGGEAVLEDQPTIDLVLLVLQGTAYVQTSDSEYKLDAPPGPGKLHWNNVTDTIEVRRLDKLPESILPKTAEELVKFKAICATACKLMDAPLDKVLEEWINSDDPMRRRGAVVVYGALDKLPRLLDALNDPKHADVRDNAVTVLRHWVGRGPGQATALYQEGVKRKKVTPVQAKNYLHLLYGFTDQERKEPATYDMLLTYLGHSATGIRELARWHLVRLVPGGHKIAYDAAAPPEQRARAIAEWRALIPEGGLPKGLTPSKK